MIKLINFLEKLEKNKIYYKLGKVRESIMVELAVPGERWEIEFMIDGTIEIEKFLSTGQILNEEELDILFKNFSD